ncbi:hypothetical protein [Mesorhizobium sp. M0520]|uniref:hypothetical protein n=1 Tax=Mesorhizobium sp. M0520 TaxID=2956957 RepID=UPI0033386CC0
MTKSTVLPNSAMPGTTRLYFFLVSFAFCWSLACISVIGIDPVGAFVIWIIGAGAGVTYIATERNSSTEQMRHWIWVMVCVVLAGIGLFFLSDYLPVKK